MKDQIPRSRVVADVDGEREGLRRMLDQLMAVFHPLAERGDERAQGLVQRIADMRATLEERVCART